jgi:uncharacterized membrane protein
MKKCILFSLLFVFFPYDGSAERMLVSFESYDMPGWYIGVVNEDVILLELETEIDREYTTFNFVSGLADKAYTSIQAASDPNYYWTHQNNIIKLQEYSAWMLYIYSATWKVIQGFADTNNRNLVSFRTWNYPDMIIRRHNRRLFLEKSDGSELFKKNATFITRPPNWDGKNKLSKKRTGENSLSRSREASFAAFIFYIVLVTITLVIVVINLRKKKWNLHVTAKKRLK